MPRVTFVKAARKDNPVAKKGESYFWWKFRHGGKRFSLTRPRPSQLTQSAYYGTVRSLVEQIEDANIQDNDEFISVRDDIVSELENLRDETQGSLDNMPDQLQYAPTGELLQERIDACESAVDEVQGLDEFDEDEPERDDFDGDEDDEVNTEDFNVAQNEWQESMNNHIENAVSEMIEAVSNCEV